MGNTSYIRYFKNSETDVDLKTVNVYKEDGLTYLALIYKMEDSTGEYEIAIPKVGLPVSNHEFGINIKEYVGHEPYGIIEFQGGDFELPIIYDKNIHGLYQVKTIKQKKRKMTVAEIEKELGYSVEIISKK